MDHVIELALLLCLAIPSFNSLVMVYLSSVVSPILKLLMVYHELS